MSNPVSETCPKCGDNTMPSDGQMKVYGLKLVVEPYVNLWRYECGCGWFWANLLQRQHNNRAVDKVVSVLSQRGWS